MKIRLAHCYQNIISLDNLLKAWREFVAGKRQRDDVQEFQLRLMDNILSLHQALDSHTYRHGGYQPFSISDPKPRRIHKASVWDRLLHHAICRLLYPFFERSFDCDSFSCRLEKGTHKALNRFRRFAYQVSRNHTRTAWILKCDIKKFFASIDQVVLMEILKRYIPDADIIWLLEQVMYSFSTAPGQGLPLGNLTSQLFVNVYMNEFDQWIKHTLKAEHYIRYADDFVVLSENKNHLITLIPPIQQFLQAKLKLTLHPDKVFLKTLASGVDFLGWVHFPDHRVLRTVTRRRMEKRLASGARPENAQSYLGLLEGGNTDKLRRYVMGNISPEI